MARVNITVSDDLLAGARAAHLNVSRVAAAALSEELTRRAKLVALDDYLRELDVALGPVSTDDQLAAQEWADQVLGVFEGQEPGAADEVKTA